MAYANSRPRTPEICPVCGESVPRRSRACPECGADHKSGWKEDYLDGVDLPGEEFDYDDFVAKEFGSGPKKGGVHPVWWITAVLLLFALAWLYWRP